MNPSERSAMLNQMSEEICLLAWQNVKLQNDNVIVAASDTSNELASMQLDPLGLIDGDNAFDMELWESELSTLQGLPLWYAGLVFPYRNGLYGEPTCAVVSMDAFSIHYAKIDIAVVEGDAIPVGWQPLIPFQQLNDLLAILRRAVAPQG